MAKIRSFRKYELDVETKRGQLSTVRLDASSLDAIKQLKGWFVAALLCASRAANPTKYDHNLTSLDGGLVSQK